MELHLKPCNDHPIILQRLQSYNETNLEVLSCLFLISQLLAYGILTVHNGFHHLLQLLTLCISSPQVYL
jgi:hypothetical protein